MTVASVPVDLLNPGQVFACLGFVELAEAQLGATKGAFDWSDPLRPRFLLQAAGDVDPFDEGLRFLEHAEFFSIAPPGFQLNTEKWRIPSHEATPAAEFPIPLPNSPAALPAVMVLEDARISLHSWGEVNLADALGTLRDNVKFWAGAGGYPGVGLLRDALEAVRPLPENTRTDPFNAGTVQSSSFRFDWRRDYIPLDVGFSLNEHSKMQPRGYPLVEILAAIGLTHARPKRGNSKLVYTYGVAGRAQPHQEEEETLLPPPLLRAALGRAEIPFPTRTFTMQLDWPGQENQARCITQVYEETNTP